MAPAVFSWFLHFLFCTDIHPYAKDEPKLHHSHAFGCLLIMATAFINYIFFFFKFGTDQKKDDTSFFSMLLFFFSPLRNSHRRQCTENNSRKTKKKTHEKQLPSFSYFSYKLLFFRRYKKDAHTHTHTHTHKEQKKKKLSFHFNVDRAYIDSSTGRKRHACKQGAAFAFSSTSSFWLLLLCIGDRIAAACRAQGG